MAAAVWPNIKAGRTAGSIFEAGPLTARQLNLQLRKKAKSFLLLYISRTQVDVPKAAAADLAA